MKFYVAPTGGYKAFAVSCILEANQPSAALTAHAQRRILAAGNAGKTAHQPWCISHSDGVAPCDGCDSSSMSAV
jgi:hypothetical protein